MEPEEKTYKCEPCEREFKTEEALEMHNKAKHSEKIEKKEDTKVEGKGSRKIRNWGIFIIIAGLVVWGIVALGGNTNSLQGQAVTDINIGSHQAASMHIHSNLDIFINGEQFFIPSNIGLSHGVMRPLHTHDSSGEIHIESPVLRDFTIGEFFQVWREDFDSNCVFDNCVDNGELKMFVNGQENFQFENYIMRDGDNIKIEYNSVVSHGAQNSSNVSSIVNPSNTNTTNLSHVNDSDHTHNSSDNHS